MTIIAPTWSMKGAEFYDQPQMRLYYTYAFRMIMSRS
ncbi:hypothetical protein [Acinetobacter lactucae]